MPSAGIDIYNERLRDRIVAQPNGCWLWTGKPRSDGYGVVRVNRVLHRVHVLVWTIWNGPVPAGLVLDHEVCDNPPCCNPAHLRPKTIGDNVRRGRSARPRTHCRRGHEKPPGLCPICNRTRKREWARANRKVAA